MNKIYIFDYEYDIYYINSLSLLMKNICFMCSKISVESICNNCKYSDSRELKEPYKIYNILKNISQTEYKKLCLDKNIIDPNTNIPLYEIIHLPKDMILRKKKEIDDGIDNLVDKYGIRYVFKNYILSDDIIQNIVDNEYSYIQDEMDISYYDIKLYQNKLF